MSSENLTKNRERGRIAENSDIDGEKYYRQKHAMLITRGGGRKN